jgi:hypothetical protein
MLCFRAGHGNGGMLAGISPDRPRNGSMTAQTINNVACMLFNYTQNAREIAYFFFSRNLD